MSTVAQRLQAAWLSRGVLAWALWPVSLVMGALVWVRHQAYRRGWLSQHRLPVPVVVVGNRIVGGAGKTPSTLALLAHLRQRGWHPGVLSRGYGATGRAADAPPVLIDQSNASPDVSLTGDEPLLIWRRSGAPLAISADRVRGGHALLQRHPEVDILVCDDGLQHLRLARDLEIVVYDERGAGNGWLLPAGPLREPVDAPTSRGLACPPIVLYNAPRASTSLPGHVSTSTLAQPVALAAWWGSKPGAEPPAPSAVTAEKCWAMAGVAHPERFFSGLRAQGWRFTPLPLADHAVLDGELPWPASLPHLLVTEKDAVKLQPERCARERPRTQIWVVGLDFQPAATFWAALDAGLTQLRRRSH